MLTAMIDARPLRNDLSGVGQYVLHLGLALLERDDIEVRLMAFDFLGRSNPLLRSAALRPFGDALRTRTLLHRKVFNALAAFTPDKVAATTMPRGLDVLHGTYFEKLPSAGRAARVSTVHDVAFLRYPQFFSRQNLEASKRALHQQLDRSDVLLAVSEFTRREVVELCGVDPSRVRVTPLAPTQTAPVMVPGPRERPYFLFIGNLEPRKNLPRCLDAWRGSGLHRDFDLIVVGAQLRSQVDHELGLGDVPGVVAVGYVDAPTKWALLRGATGFLWPSIYEGFGIPVPEAMSVGTPVITSRGSAMEELTGDLAYLVEATDVDEIAAALHQVANDETSARIRGEAGIDRAATFTWEATADRTLDAYRDAIAKS